MPNTKKNTSFKNLKIKLYLLIYTYFFYTKLFMQIVNPHYHIFCCFGEFGMIENEKVGVNFRYNQ